MDAKYYTEILEMHLPTTRGKEHTERKQSEKEETNSEGQPEERD